MLSRPNRSKDTLRDRILHVLSGAPIPMDVENVRIKSGLKNWESTKALLLELFVGGLISGQKTTKSTNEYRTWSAKPKSTSSSPPPPTDS